MKRTRPEVTELVSKRALKTYKTGLNCDLRSKTFAMENAKMSRGKRWGHPETVNLLEGVIENADDFSKGKGRLETRLNFFEKEVFNRVKEGGRSTVQMNVRLENLYKEYRKVSDLF